MPRYVQAARALQKQGIAFQVFEAYDDVAGIWRANYTTYKAQGNGDNAHICIVFSYLQL